MISADVVAWGWIAGIATSIIFGGDLKPDDLTPVQAALVFAPWVAIPVAVIVGIVSLALNISLLRKLYRERARLKELGLSSLSKSLWKESWRSRWISRARGALTIFVGTFMTFSFLAYLMLRRTPTLPEEIESDWRIRIFVLLLFFATIPFLLFSAHYLRNLRQRMELTANAKELKRALEGLRQRAGKTDVVSVPSELLEQVARIESAQIAKERNDAVLKSVAVRPSGYAITFDRDAAEERATLGVADRVELEDLVAQLSTDGAQLESQAGAVAGAEGGTLRGITKSQRVEIAYVIDQASHGIRIVAVQHRGDGSPNGHSHA
jgi:hypothetical protein